MRNFLFIALGIVVFNAILLYSGGFEYIKNTFTPEPEAPKNKTDVNDVFRATLEAGVREKIGTPIEGYEPNMFMQAYPGLAATDFNNVQASIGKYVVQDGQLTHQMDPKKLVHSAAGAITKEGMKTLLRNITQRIGIDLNNGGTLTEVMNAISAQQ